MRMSIFIDSWQLVRASIVSMPASLFENKPEYCLFGHRLWARQGAGELDTVPLPAGPGGCRTRPRHGTRPGRVHQLP
jgi:hypothetical protein